MRPVPCLLFAVALALAAGGCTTPASGHKLSWRTLSRGLTSGLQEPRRLVLRDEAAYLRVWAEHAADVNRPALPPNVDFSREMVVLLALGTRPTGGYLVEVVDVELRGRTLRVLVAEREPQPGSLQIQQLTQPYQFIALPTVASHVRFHTVRESGAAARSRKARPGEEGPRESESPRSAPSKPVTPLRSPRGAATAQ